MSDRLARMEGRLLRPLLSALLLSMLASGSAFAQIVDIPAIMDPSAKGPPTFVQLQYGHQFETDVDDDGTDYARNNVLFGIGHRAQMNEKTSLFTMATYTLQSYDFGGGDGDGVPLVPPNGILPNFREGKFYQWNEIHRLVLGGLIGYDVSEQWRLIGGGIVRSWGETGADYGDSITGGLILGFSYEKNENFNSGLLIGLFNSLEGGIGILPVPTIDWRFAESWNFHTGLVSVFDPGIGAELGFQVSDTVSLGTGFAFQSREFRLRDRARVAKSDVRGNRNRTDDGGVGSETGIPIFANLKWRPTKKSSIDLLGGVTVGGNLRVEDADGNRIKDHDYDPAPFLGFKGQIFF
jgi:hypothetical protein